MLTTFGGVGGNRTPVRQVVIACATTIPGLWLTVATLAGQSSLQMFRPVFPRSLRTFSVVSKSFLASPLPLLLPGCESLAPCAVSGHYGSLQTELNQAARANSVVPVLCVPCLTSLSNSGRTHGFLTSTSKPINPWYKNYLTSCAGVSANVTRCWQSALYPSKRQTVLL